MTGNEENRTLFEERSSTRLGAQGLAAARLAVKVVRILLGAMRTTAISQKELAKRLNISEGRVSQVLNGDGNVHISTLAKFMRAMDYEVEIVARPLRPELPVLDGTSARRRPARSTARPQNDYEHYEQLFLTSHGVMRVPMFVPSDDTLGCVPEGKPQHVGRVTIAGGKVSRSAKKLAARPSNWHASTPPVRITN